MTTHSFRQRDAQASADPSINAIDTISRDREISCTECLLLTQAAYEYGSDWASIAQLLQAHPLIKPPKDFFSQDVCQSLYKKLLLNAGMSFDEKESGPKSAQSQKLARSHYDARVAELRELIMVEEARFKQLSLEIDEIRSGAWDNRIAKHTDTSKAERTMDKATTGTDDEADSKQVQSEIVAQDEAMADTVAGDMELDAPSGRTTSEEPIQTTVIEEFSSGEEPGKGRGASRRGRSKAKSPAIRKSRRLSQATPPPSTPRGDEQETKRSPLRKGNRLSNEEGGEQHETHAETVLAPSAPLANRRISKRKASSVEAPVTPRDVKRVREDSEPTIIEEDDEQEEESPNALRQKRAAFQQTILLLHQQFHNHRHGVIFHSQVKDTDADNYKDIVKRPMDLKTIRAKVKEGTISNSDEYLRDIYLMFANALMYNAPGTTTYEHAKSMLTDLENAIHDHKLSESFNKK